MGYTATGTISHIGQTETVGQSGFQKRGFVVSSQDGQYTNEYAFELVKDKVDRLDRYSVGQSVTVNFNIRCREYNGRWYTNLTAWKIDAEQSAPSPTAPHAPPMPPPDAPPMPPQTVAPQAQPQQPDLGGNDGIPF